MSAISSDNGSHQSKRVKLPNFAANKLQLKKLINDADEMLGH